MGQKVACWLQRGSSHVQEGLAVCPQAIHPLWLHMLWLVRGACVEMLSLNDNEDEMEKIWKAYSLIITDERNTQKCPNMTCQQVLQIFLNDIYTVMI